MLAALGTDTYEREDKVGSSTKTVSEYVSPFCCCRHFCATETKITERNTPHGSVLRLPARGHSNVH